MEDDYYDVILNTLGVICAVAIAQELKSIGKRWKNRRWWTKQWVLRRNEGNRDVHSMVNNELRNEDPEAYRIFLKMDEKSFNKLLGLVGPKISRQNTVMRESISAERRLSLTLRYLATGESYKSLRFSYRIPASTIGTIIPEVCQAIFDVLMENYLKIPTNADEWREISQDFLKLWNFPNC